MRLEDVTVALRPREPWEAVDLGCSMVRRDFGQLMALWAATVLPVWLVIIVLMRDVPAAFTLVIWWLKPLYDRVPLFFISKAAFGVRPGFRETWKAWPRLWSRDLFAALVLRRLSMIRSFALPVIMLEGQKGKAMRARIRALATDGGGSGATVTWVFVKLEIVVWMGLIAFSADFVPESISPNWAEWMQFQDAADFVIQPAYYWWLNICYLLAVTLVEPFYVGSGFGVYLNCRTRLEGWDVELAFRRLATRLRGALAVAAACIVLLPVCAGASIGSPAKQHAAPSRETSAFKQFASETRTSKDRVAATPETQAANKAADEILNKPEFKVHKRTVKQWKSDAVESRPDFDLLRIFGYIAIWLAAAAVIAAIVVFLMRNRHLLGLPQRMPQMPMRQTGPRVVMGMDIGRDSLPDDVVAASRALWKTGGRREALSLLYRGALSELVARHRLPIRESDTEDDCLDHVRRVGERQTAGYFSTLTRAWIGEAYAGITPAESEFERLCGAWPFLGAASPSRKVSPASAMASLLIMTCVVSCSGHWEDEEKTLGYKGKARIDPFLAAEMLLKENGHKAERTPTLGKLPDASNGIVFTAGEGGVPEGRAKQLLAWVSRGGHLVYSLAGSMPYNDWSEGSDFFINFGTDERPDPILTKLGVKVNDHRPKIDIKGIKKSSAPKPKARAPKSGKPVTEKDKEAARIGDTVVMRQLKWGSQTYAVQVSDKITFTISRPPRPGEWSTDGTEPSILSLHHGAGRVTLLNHARPLRNKHLADNDHAAWLLALAGENQRAKKDVRFVVGMTTGFWSLLWQNGWRPLVALAFFVGVWLWANTRRFGPVMPVELTGTKHFTDHISALGQFFFRLRRGDVLLKAAADGVRSRFKQRFPQLAAGGDEVVIPRLAEQSGLTPERVQAALAAHPPGQNHQLVRLLHDLQLLRKSIP